MAASVLQPGAVTTQAGSINTAPLPQTYSFNPDISQSSVNSGLFGAGANALSSLVNGGFNLINSAIQRNWNEKMFDKQNEWNLNMWNMTNEYNSPSAQFQRLKDAGLNPLYYGLDGSSANAMQSAQPLGYERASASGVFNPFDAFLKGRMADAQLANIEAQTTKIKSETDSTVLDNEFKQRTLNARVEGEQLANDLTKVQIEKISDERKEISERIRNIAQNTKTEAARELLMYAQEHVAKCQAREITELLPYRKALMSAETAYQRAAASLASWNALYQRDLVQNGYVEKQIELLDERIRHESNQADLVDRQRDLADFKARVRAGQSIDVDSIPKWMITDRIAASFWNSIMSRCSEITEACGSIVGPVIGFAAGKGMAGKAALQAEKNAAPFGRGYGASGSR